MTTLPIKLAVIGDTGVGKTSLLLRFVNGTFTDTASETAQVDKISCSITIDGRKHDLDVWDTAGQEQFGGVTPSYYRKAIGGIVVYDSTNEESFEDVEQWIEDVGTYADPKVKIILVGNKCDLKEKQVVDASNAQGMAKSKGILFIETSAKGDINVKQLFEMLVREIFKESTQQTQPQTQGIKLENDKGNQNHNSKCCK
eukprot:Em0019g780a